MGRSASLAEVVLRADNELYAKLRQRDLIQESYDPKSIIKKLISYIKDLAFLSMPATLKGIGSRIVLQVCQDV